jgi:hypothetical protein
MNDFVLQRGVESSSNENGKKRKEIAYDNVGNVRV